MNLHNLAKVLAFNILLLAITGPVKAQPTSCLFTSTRDMPARLFGSTSECGRETTCSQTTLFGGERTQRCGTPFRRPLRGLTSTCGCEPSCSCEASHGCVSSGNCATPCRCSSRDACSRPALSRAMVQLEAATSRLFGCRRSHGCEACCYRVQYYAAKPVYGYEAGCRCEPDGSEMPEPEEELEIPSSLGDPFEDDPVQPLSPRVASEARDGDDSRLPVVGTVSYTRPTSPLVVVSPARFRPDNAVPLSREDRPASSILVRED